MEKSSSELQAEQRTPSALKCQEIGRYTIAGAVVFDANERRVWQRDVDPQRRTQREAITYCASLELDGHRGWRLPDASELVDIRYLPGLIEGGPSSCMPSIDQNAFPDTPPDIFWTRTERPDDQGVFTDFADGRSHFADPKVPAYVRCVHGLDVSTLAVHPTPALER